MRVVALVLALAATAHADLLEQLDTPVLRGFRRSLAASVGKSLPIPAASSGITFRFDPKTSAFERETEVLGQVFLERARPIGRGKLNLNLTYQHVDIDQVDGRSLDSLWDPRAIRDPSSGVPFLLTRLDVELVTHMVTTSATYGLSDDLEVNLTVPVLYTEADSGGQLRQLGGRPLPFQGGADDDSALGVGDVFLRGKYRFLRGRFGEVAAGLVFRLPAGDEDDFQGTGLFEVGPRIYASTPAVELAPHVRAQAFANAGLDLTPEDADRHEGRFGVGVDVMLGKWVTLSVALLAREPFGRAVPPGTLDVPRTGGSSPIAPPGGRSPIFGLDPGRVSYYDLAIGGRVNLWRDTVFGIAHVVVPANPDDGVRASIVPLFGLEAAF